MVFEFAHAMKTYPPALFDVCCKLCSLVLGGVLTFEPEEAKARATPMVTKEGLVYSNALK